VTGRQRIPIAVAAAGIAVAVGLSACGGRDSGGSGSTSGGATVDSKAVERVLYKQFSNASRLIYIDVNCPADVPVETGGTFTCKITGQNQVSGSVSVTQRDPQGKTIAFDGTMGRASGAHLHLTGTTTLK
jgi:hypothetical protein